MARRLRLVPGLRPDPKDRCSLDIGCLARFDFTLVVPSVLTRFRELGKEGGVGVKSP